MTSNIWGSGGETSQLTSANNTWSGTNNYTVFLPTSSLVPGAGNEHTNKAYVDLFLPLTGGTVSGMTTIQQVLNVWSELDSIPLNDEAPYVQLIIANTNNEDKYVGAVDDQGAINNEWVYNHLQIGWRMVFSEGYVAPGASVSGNYYIGFIGGSATQKSSHMQYTFKNGTGLKIDPASGIDDYTEALYVVGTSKFTVLPVSTDGNTNPASDQLITRQYVDTAVAQTADEMYVTSNYATGYCGPATTYIVYGTVSSPSTGSPVIGVVNLGSKTCNVQISSWPEGVSSGWSVNITNNASFAQNNVYLALEITINGSPPNDGIPAIWDLTMSFAAGQTINVQLNAPNGFSKTWDWTQTDPLVLGIHNVDLWFSIPAGYQGGSNGLVCEWPNYHLTFPLATAWNPPSTGLSVFQPDSLYFNMRGFVAGVYLMNGGTGGNAYSYPIHYSVPELQNFGSSPAPFTGEQGAANGSYLVNNIADKMDFMLVYPGYGVQVFQSPNYVPTIFLSYYNYGKTMAYVKPTTTGSSRSIRVYFQHTEQIEP